MSHSASRGRSAAVLVLAALPASARTEATANPRSVLISDLSPAQQAQANGKDSVAIVDGDTVTYLAPTGDFRAAYFTVKEERESQGI